MVETGKQNFMQGIKEKVVVITGASSGIGHVKARKKSNAPRLCTWQANGARTRVMTVVRRSSRRHGMPDAFDRAPLR